MMTLGKKAVPGISRFMVRRLTLLCSLCLLLFTVGCANYLKYYPYSFNREPAQAVRKVAVAPLNLFSAAPPYVGDRGTAVYNGLVSYMNDHGVAAESAELVDRVWKEEQEKIGGIYNSRNGRLDNSKFAICLRSTVTKVCDALSVDALVFPGIVQRTATLNGRFIYWDGTSLHIEVENGLADPLRENFSGTSEAISLSILIIDKNDRLLLKNVAGIEHPVKAVLNGPKVGWETRKDLLKDKARIDHAIAVGLYPFIPFSGYPENPSFSKK